MTLDTNIIIAYMAGEEDAILALSVWREAGSVLFLPAVAETEVLAFGGWNDEERKRAEIFLTENFVFIPFDRSLTKIAARIRRDSKVKFPDAAIAATAIFTQTALVTRNIKDFKKVPNLLLQKI